MRMLCLIVFASACGQGETPAVIAAPQLGEAGRPAPVASVSTAGRVAHPSDAGAASTQPATAGGGSSNTAGRSAVAASAEPPAAGSGGSTSASAGTPSLAAGAPAPAADGRERKPRCLKQPSELIVLGDSYLNWLTHSFPDDFTREFGAGYRLYAEPGASMASGGIATPVPDQLAMAISDDPDISAGVMTGGGNDILLPDTDRYPGSDECKERADSPSLKVCQDVVGAALIAAKTLIETGAKAGIEDVVYIYYPRIPGNLFGIYATSPNEILEYSQPMARAICDQAEADTNGKLRCHFLDLQPIFEGHPDWFADDGIHENTTGSAVIAQEIVALLKRSCIAQPESSGCCDTSSRD